MFLMLFLSHNLCGCPAFMSMVLFCPLSKTGLTNVRTTLRILMCLTTKLSTKYETKLLIVGSFQVTNQGRRLQMQQWLSGYRKPRFPCEEQYKWDLPGEKG
jgi:hypothetical protein